MKAVLTARVDPNALKVAIVPGHFDDSNAFDYFHVSVDQFKLARIGDGFYVLRIVACAVPLVRRERVLELAALNDVAGARERRNNLPVSFYGVRPRVIEMQVRVNHYIYIFRLKIKPAKLREYVGFVANRITVERASVPLVTDSRVYEDVFTPRADQQRVQTDANAVLLIRLEVTLPDYARNNAKERASVERERAVGYNVNFESAELHI